MHIGTNPHIQEKETEREIEIERDRERERESLEGHNRFSVCIENIKNAESKNAVVEN